MLLYPGSPALNRYTTGCPTEDERGVARPPSGPCASGAVEMRASDFQTLADEAAGNGGGGGDGTGGGGVPLCRDLDHSTAARTATTLHLRCTPGVWRWVVTVAPEHGTLGPIDAQGNVTYTPDPGFHGDDRLRYVAENGSGRSNAALAVLHVGGEDAAAVPAPKPTPRTCTATVRLNPSGTRFVRVRVNGAPAKVQRSGQVWRATVTVSDGRATLHVNGRRPDGGLTKRTLSVTC
jgi:hypothetical protein